MPCSAAIIAGFETRTWATMCGLYPHLINSNQHNRRRLSCFMTKWNVKGNSCVLAREELVRRSNSKGFLDGGRLDWVIFQQLQVDARKAHKKLVRSLLSCEFDFYESYEMNISRLIWKIFGKSKPRYTIYGTRTANVLDCSGHIKRSSCTCEASSKQLLWNFIKLEASTQLPASPRWPNLKPSPLGDIRST